MIDWDDAVSLLSVIADIPSDLDLDVLVVKLDEEFHQIDWKSVLAKINAEALTS